MLVPFRVLWRHRHILYHTTVYDVRSRYLGSALGVTWTILNPFLLLSVYVIVFQFIFRIRLPEYTSMEYTAAMFTGMIPWFGFNDAIMGSLHSLTSNPSLIRSSSFPTIALPTKAVFAGMFTQIIGLIILLIILAMTDRISWAWAFLPLAFFVQILFTIGSAWILAVINVFIRDLGQSAPVFLMLLMFLSPVIWLPEMMPNSLSTLLYLNPMYYLISLYRLPLFYGQIPSPFIIIVALVTALAVFTIGFRFFNGIKHHLVDHV